MSDTKKSSRSSSGSFLVVGLLLACAAAAYLSVVHYRSQVASTDGAQLLYEGQVMATFADSSAPRIDDGMSATVTIKGYADQKFSGSVKLTHVEENGETTAIIQLANAPADAQPPVPCRVTIDTTGLSMIKGG